MRSRRRRVLISLLVVALGLAFAPGVAAAAETAMALAQWVRRAGDNAGLPFLVVDKVEARVLAFDADGQLLGATTALLGSAPGDESVPGIGDRELAAIRPEERTTPAGRFLAGFGREAGGGEQFWVDYATAISLHPVVTTNPKEHRLQRLRSPSAGDNRITFGCINVARGFFDATIRPTFKGTRSVVYILPEMRPMADVFPTFAAQAQADALTGVQVDAVSAPPPPAEPARSGRRSTR